MSFIGTIRDAITGLTAEVSARTQTPTGNALQVQIGPGDLISNIPVVMDFLNHQIHEGETFCAIYDATGINASTVKFGFTVATYATTIQAPHLTIEAGCYDGAVLVKLYKTASFTSGSAVTFYNRNQNSANTDSSTLKSGVTSTNGTLIDAFYAGAGQKASGTSGIRDEWVLESNSVYRIDVIGQVNPSNAFIKFVYYADKGV